MRSRDVRHFLFVVLFMIMWGGLGAIIDQAKVLSYVLIGFAMGIVIALAHIASDRAQRAEKPSRKVNQKPPENTRSIDVPFGVEQAYVLCRRALQIVGATAPITDDREQGILVSRLITGAYRYSNRDKLTVKYSALADTSTRITVTSQPNPHFLSFSLVDYDPERHLNTVMRIIGFLETVGEFSEGELATS